MFFVVQPFWPRTVIPQLFLVENRYFQLCFPTPLLPFWPRTAISAYVSATPPPPFWARNAPTMVLCCHRSGREPRMCFRNPTTTVGNRPHKFCSSSGREPQFLHFVSATPPPLFYSGSRREPHRLPQCSWQCRLATIGLRCFGLCCSRSSRI